MSFEKYLKKEFIMAFGMFKKTTDIYSIIEICLLVAEQERRRFYFYFA